MPLLNTEDDFLDTEYIQNLCDNDILVLLKTIIACAHSGIVVGSSTPQTPSPFVVWNKCATEILGIGPTDTTPSQWTEVYQIKNPITKEPLEEHEIPLVCALKGFCVHNRVLLIGENTYISCNAMPIKKDGEIVGGVVVFHDVTKSFNEKSFNEKIFDGKKKELQDKLHELVNISTKIKNLLK